MKSRLIVLILVIGLMACPGLASCSRPNEFAGPRTIDHMEDPAAYSEAARRLSQGGNMAYGNFILYADGAYWLTGTNEHVSRLSAGSARPVAIHDMPGHNFTSDEGWLFYTAGQLNNSVRKIKTDGSNDVRISSLSFTSLIAEQGQLWSIQTNSGQVMGQKQDGTQRRILFDGFASSILYQDGFLYVSAANSSSGLIKIDPATGISTRLLDRRISSLNIEGDWFYYADPADKNRVHAWSPNQENDRCTSDLSLARPFIIYDGWLFYIDTDDQNRLYRLPVRDGCLYAAHKHLVVDDVVASFVLLPDAVYYRRPADGRVYTVALQGGQISRIG